MLLSFLYLSTTIHGERRDQQYLWSKLREIVSSPVDSVHLFPHFLMHFAVFVKCCVISAAIHTIDFIWWDTIFCMFMCFLAYIFFMTVCWMLVATDGTPRLVFTNFGFMATQLLTVETLNNPLSGTFWVHLEVHIL